MKIENAIIIAGEVYEPIFAEPYGVYDKPQYPKCDICDAYRQCNINHQFSGTTLCETMSKPMKHFRYLGEVEDIKIIEDNV